jgi:hypothetical protein
MDDQPTAGAEPLRNRRHEAFAQAYAGEAWGNASQAFRSAGYKPKDDHNAAVCAARLLTKADISARIRHMRAQWQADLQVDAKTILEARKAIATDPEAFKSDRLAAWRDIEKALGLARPDRLDVTSGGAPVRCEIVIVPRGGATDAKAAP